MTHLEVEILLAENPTWECRDFDEHGVFVGSKYLCDKIEELIEEEING